VIIDYLPALGPEGPLTDDLLNPTSSASGAFGGIVVALRLDVDFSDAGLLTGNLDLPFGDLVLYGFDGTESFVNGLTVREFLAEVESALGGGPAFDSYENLRYLTQDLSSAFVPNGVVSDFALAHLDLPTTNPESVPEPATLWLLGSGLAGLIAARRRMSP
jgi:PEP-CTERM motif